MSTKENAKREARYDKETGELLTEDVTYDEETGLPEGLDPGYDYMDGSPEMKSEPIPLPYGNRLVGLTPEEAWELLAKERVERAEAAVEAQKNHENPQTADEELAAAKAEHAEAEKARAAAEKEAGQQRKEQEKAQAQASRSSS